ncbi:MAG: hypothetical protein CFH19_00680 [Alphaproteobacteria bacterium MarineAlpha5_Bin9]|nr:MAG: hypothetical protein CFH19_00680 [Alphaproteobacteria bacterium MarineAlpha5_Bin9]
MINISSIKSANLTNKQINDICKLKNSFWNFGIKSQIKWYKKNTKKSDIHNLLYIKNKLIGYTYLRKRSSTILVKNKSKKIKYIYFDTLIINKSFRKKNISKILMEKNNEIILKSKLHSFLICKKKLILFYKKFNWKKIPKKKIIVKDHLFNDNGMIFNHNILKLKKADYKNLKIEYFLYK